MLKLFIVYRTGLRPHIS